MARVNATQWLDKWGRNLGGSQQFITDGVNRVTVAPSEGAIQAKGRMLEGIQAAVADGRWEKGLRKVSLQSWRDSMIKKGLPRLAQGIEGAKANKVNNIQALLTAVDTSKAAADALPKGGLEQGIQRANAFMRAMSANAPKRNGGAG